MIIKTLSYVLSIIILYLIFDAMTLAYVENHRFIQYWISFLVVSIIKSYRSAFTICAKFDALMYSPFNRSIMHGKILEGTASFLDKISFMFANFVWGFISPKQHLITIIISIIAYLLLIFFK
jgi:hypothetical protein